MTRCRAACVSALILGVWLASDLVGIAAAQTSLTDFCARENGRYVLACQASCYAACNTPSFASRTAATLAACREVRDRPAAQRADSAECARLKPPPPPPPPEPLTIGRLGLEAETCVINVEKGETIEEKISRIGNPRLKDTIATFWSGRPKCAISAEALVDTFQCIQGGVQNISQGYAAIRGKTTLKPNQNKAEFCAAAKPLTEGTTYTELEQVDERVAKFDTKVKDLNECAKAFREWTQKPSTGEERDPDLVRGLEDQLQANLDNFASADKSFKEIRSNINAMKREIARALARAVDQCQ